MSEGVSPGPQVDMWEEEAGKEVKPKKTDLLLR